MPKILLVHLKRFSFSGPFRDKIDTFVDFPVRGLDLFTYLASPLKQQLVDTYNSPSQSTNLSSKYDLYAISNHYGGLNGGHYTACVRQPSRSAWVNFDDSRVTEVCSTDTEKEDKIKTIAAYSLFYVSRSVSQ